MKRTVYILMISLALLSCSEEKEVKPLTYTQVFSGKTSKTWRIDQVLVKKIGTADQPIEFSTCELDDLYTFNADEEKSFVITNGATKCEADEPDEYVRDTWSFVNAGAVMNIAVPRIFGNFIVPFIVKQATTERLVLEIYADQANTISYQLEFSKVNEE